MEPTERIWLAAYPPGVPSDIDPARYASLVDLIEDSFRQHAARTAYEFMGARLSYDALDRHSAAVAAWLQEGGIQPGDRVAVMLPNVLAFPAAFFGILRAGAVVVTVNPLYTAHELSAQLADSGATTLFVLENFAHVVEAALPGTALARVVVCSLGDLMPAPRAWLVNAVVRHVRKLVPAFAFAPGIALRLAQVLARGARHAPPRPAVQGSDIAVLQYTGGTTGISKGAMLLHANLVANVLQSAAWYSPALRRVTPGEPIVTVTALPLYHIFALTCCALLSMHHGGCCILIPNPRDLPALTGALKGRRFHVFPAVNTLFNALANHAPFRELDFSALVLSLGGGMAVQRAVAERWLEVTGCPVCEGYGLTETSPSACCNRVDTDRYSGTIGVPIPSTEIVLLDDAGACVARGQAGEIAIRGPQVMAGYWRRPDETARVMTAEGYLRTGDIGVMDETGAVRIVDRKKDMILVSGFNVYPNEVEEVVAAHPGVLECAVVGTADEHSGEAVKLFVVSRDPSLTAAQIAAYCRENLTGYKRPKHIEFRHELPKSTVGKILRRELRR